MGFLDKAKGFMGMKQESAEKPAEVPKEAELKQETSKDGKAELSSQELGKQRVDQLTKLASEKFAGFTKGLKDLGGWLAKQAFSAIGFTEKEWDRTDFKHRAEQAKKGAKVVGKVTLGVAAAPVIAAGAVGMAGMEAGKAGYQLAKKGVEVTGKKIEAANQWRKDAKNELVEAAESTWTDVKQGFRELQKQGREAKISFDRRVSQAKKDFRDWRNNQLLKLLSGAEVRGAASEAVKKSQAREERFLKVSLDLSSVQPVETGVEIEMGGEEDEENDNLLDEFVRGDLSMSEALNGIKEISAEESPTQEMPILQEKAS